MGFGGRFCVLKVEGGIQSTQELSRSGRALLASLSNNVAFSCSVTVVTLKWVGGGGLGASPAVNRDLGINRFLKEICGVVDVRCDGEPLWRLNVGFREYLFVSG